jgi:hypothetical protein
MTDEHGVPLAAMIRQLRTELTAAITAAEGKELQFALGDVELELEVGVSNEGTADAGVRLWVLTLGGNGTHRAEHVQRVKVILTPLRNGGSGDPKDVRVAAQGPLG